MFLCGELSPGAEVSFLGSIFLHLAPPVLHLPDAAPLLQLLEAGHQLVDALQAGVVEGVGVDVCRPAVLGVELGVGVHPLAQVGVAGQQEERVELHPHHAPAPGAHAEQAEGGQDDQRLHHLGGQEARVERCPDRPPLPCTAHPLAALLVDYAGQDPVPAGGHPRLVQRHPGNEPGNLQQKYSGQANGGAHAEGLEARHPGNGANAKGEYVGEASDGDGDAGVLQGQAHLLPHRRGGADLGSGG